MQLQDFLRPLQKETNRLVKSFLDENPDILKKYVEGGVTAVGLMLTPLNAFMRHLLVVQGLDPDSMPGEKQRLALLEALENFFEKRHDKDFDSDYDFSWIQKRFEETRKALNQLEMTKEKFMDLTDLSKLSSTEKTLDELVDEANPVAPEAAKRELRMEDKVEIGGDAIDALRKFVRAMEKDASPDKKPGIKTSKKKLNKGPGARVRKISANVKKETTIKEEVAAQRKANHAARAGKLIKDMIERGLVENLPGAIKEQHDQMMQWTEESLAAMERVIAKHFKQPTENKFTGSFKRVQK